ncbi:hypothetical protein ASU31_25740 [Pedobacter ginsenosidimutans]|uniref:Uncharacterized protein n=2 Tax=Pedobacter ginsenosidimutans TaxID=687842 RepID=A0A0T5VH75_9SPHI|nr:hypothetical protein ASU31_25740 [Pedobacter ginsenosidimutans]
MTALRDFRVQLKNYLEMHLSDLSVKVLGIEFDNKNRGESSMEDCLELLSKADFFIGFFAKEIGTYNQADFSGTDIEHQHVQQMNIPKIIVNLLGSDVKGNPIFKWLEASYYDTFKIITCSQGCNPLETVADHVARILKNKGRKTYWEDRHTTLKKSAVLLPQKPAEGSFDSIDDTAVKLYADYLHAVRNGNPAEVVDKYTPLYGAIKQEIKYGHLVSDHRKNERILTSIASCLETFAECFNQMDYSGIWNTEAFWCNNMASYIFNLTGNHARYKGAVHFHIHSLYAMASKLSIRSGKGNQIARKVFLDRAKRGCEYLSYLWERSKEKGDTHNNSLAVDNGFSAFVNGAMGNYAPAITNMGSIVSHFDAMGTPSAYHHAEYILLQAKGKIYAGDFSHQFGALEDYCQTMGFSSTNLIVGRKLLEIYQQHSEKVKAAALYEMLEAQTDLLSIETQRKKLNAIRHQIHTPVRYHFG